MSINDSAEPEIHPMPGMFCQRYGVDSISKSIGKLLNFEFGIKIFTLIFRNKNFQKYRFPLVFESMND